MPNPDFKVPADAVAVDHDAEVAEQEKIAANLQETAQETPNEAAVQQEQPVVTLRPVDVDSYPLRVVVTGAELTFESESDTVEVEPQVAEQVAYLPNVEVAA